MPNDIIMVPYELASRHVTIYGGGIAASAAAVTLIWYASEGREDCPPTLKASGAPLADHETAGRLTGARPHRGLYHVTRAQEWDTLRAAA